MQVSEAIEFNVRRSIVGIRDSFEKSIQTQTSVCNYLYT